METHKGTPIYTFVSLQEWMTWLEQNHATVSAIWMRFAKKGSEKQSISYAEALEGALIYGWIDGLINKIDDDFYATRFTPRTAKSGWSKVNREAAESLITQGKMQQAGLAQVQAAKSDGRWDIAYDSPSNMQVPEDFQQALDRVPGAAEFFATINRANRYAFLYRIQTAKNTAQRAERIEKYIEMLSQGELFHP